MRRAGLMPLLALLLSACEQPPQPQVFDLGMPGSAVQLEVLGVDRDRAQAAATAADEDLRFVQEVTHPWQPGPLGRTNTLLATTGEFSANPSVLALIERARELSLASDGLFNPAQGKLRALWGLHGVPRTAPPAAQEIAALLGPAPSMAAVQLQGIRMRSTNPAVQLDLEAFGRGHALDAARERLREEGLTGAVLRSPEALLTLERPAAFSLEAGAYPLSLALSANEALFMVGVATGFELAGQRHPAVLDPRSGKPARSLAAAVIHPRAADAGALASALLASGADGWDATVHRLGIEHGLLVDEHGVLHLTAAMKSRRGAHGPP